MSKTSPTLRFISSLAAGQPAWKTLLETSSERQRWCVQAVCVHMCSHGVVGHYHTLVHVKHGGSGAQLIIPVCAGLGHSDGLLQWRGAAVWPPGGLQEEERVRSSAAWPPQPQPVRQHVAGPQTRQQKLPCECVRPLPWCPFPFFFSFFLKRVQTIIFGCWRTCEVKFFFAIQARRHILTRRAAVRAWSWVNTGLF